MKSKRAFAIPFSLCVAAVVLFLGGSVAQLCAGDLQSATHEYYRERALQVADYGLEMGVAKFQETTQVYYLGSLNSALRDDRVKVVIYDNSTGGLPADSDCPVKVPQGFQYWLATGEARNGSRLMATARLGALVQWGQPLGSAGAQVRYFSVTPESFNQRASFIAVNSSQDVIKNKVICSTEAQDGSLPPVRPPELVKPVSFHLVSQLGGKVKIPTGADGTQIVQADMLPGETVDIDPTGGFFNIPAYTPPTPSKVFNLGTGTTTPSLLDPGEYDTINLAQGTGLKLHGVYHFKNLNLLPGANDYPLLENDTTGQTEVFIDSINVPANSGLKLKLNNPQDTARSFRLNFKPGPPNSPALDLEVNAQQGTYNSGGIWVVAPKRKLHVFASGRALIRGSFTCEALGLKFGPNGPGKFVYDTTADSSRIKGDDSPTRNGGDEIFRPPFDGPHPMILSKTPL
ncbi:MAG: hypothetical protein U0931_39745 [Vulcanimicrobiota bacterium]